MCFPNLVTEEIHISAAFEEQTDQPANQPRHPVGRVAMAKKKKKKRKSICQNGNTITQSAYMQHMPLCKVAIKIGPAQRTRLGASALTTDWTSMKADG